MTQILLEEKITFARRLLEAGGSLVGLSLPTAALVNLARLPKDLINLAYLILFSVSLALIVAIFIQGKDIAKLTSRKAAILTLTLAISGALTTAVYLQVSDRLVISEVIKNRNGEEIAVEVLVKPLAPTDRITKIIAEYNDNFEEALVEDNPLRMTLIGYMFEERHGSVALLLGTMLLAQLLFVAAIVGGAWWLTERNFAPARSKRR